MSEEAEKVYHKSLDSWLQFGVAGDKHFRDCQKSARKEAFEFTRKSERQKIEKEINYWKNETEKLKSKFKESLDNFDTLRNYHENKLSRIREEVEAKRRSRCYCKTLRPKKGDIFPCLYCVAFNDVPKILEAK